MAVLKIDGGSYSEATRVSSALEGKRIKGFSIQGHLPSEGGGVSVYVEGMNEEELRELLNAIGCQVREVQEGPDLLSRFF